MLENKKKGRLRCHRRPKSREETPKEGSDAGWGRYHIPLTKTSRSAAQLHLRDYGPIQRFMALTLEAEHFRNGSISRHSAMPAQRFFNRITQCRRVVTRCDKRAAKYLA